MQNKQTGFSLVEALISLTILLAGIAGMAAAFQNTIFQTVASKNQSQAAVIASSVVAELSQTDPADWDSDEINNRFKYDFNGERIDPDDSDPPVTYYQVAVTATPTANWYQVVVGVTWTGWSKEQSRSGNINDNSNFAYVLEVSLMPAYGDVQ